MDHAKLADDIIDKVGGKDNVTNLGHCATRLRYKLQRSSRRAGLGQVDFDAADGTIKIRRTVPEANLTTQDTKASRITWNTNIASCVPLSHRITHDAAVSIRYHRQNK